MRLLSSLDDCGQILHQNGNDLPPMRRQTRRNLYGALIILVIAPLLANMAFPAKAVWAASFSCSKASTSRERTVCADPNLSKLDDTLDATYRADLSKLDDVGAASIRADQRAWLKAIDLLCRDPVLNDPEDNYHQNVRACLRARYEHRIFLLQEAVIKNKEATFYYVDRIFPGHYPYYGARRFFEAYSVHYPQIDHPDATGLAWNRAMARVPDPGLEGVMHLA